MLLNIRPTNIWINLIVLMIGVLLIIGPAELKHRLIDLEFSERLSRDELLASLDDIVQLEPALVASFLSQAKCKETTEVMDGVTVANLLQQNEIDIENCNINAFKKRVYFCGNISGWPLVNVELYCRRLILEAAEYCVENRDEIDDDGIFLSELKNALSNMKYQEPLTPSNMRLTAVEWCVLLETDRYPDRIVIPMRQPESKPLHDRPNAGCSNLTASTTNRSDGLISARLKPQPRFTH